MDATRVAATGSVGLTGFGLLAGALSSYRFADSLSAAAVALVVVGALVGSLLIAAAGYLYRSDVTTTHTRRVAGWNLLGVVGLGAILAIATTDPAVSLPAYVAVSVLGISSVAHVLIGYNDVHRIRAKALADERERLAVINRLVRHNLRNEAQILASYGEQIRENTDQPDIEQFSYMIQDIADELSGTHEGLEAFRRALDEAEPTERVELEPLVAEVLEDYRAAYPDGTFETDLASGVSIRADEQLAVAIDHLIDNAVEHAGFVETYVYVSVTETKGLVRVTVADRGPGLPDEEIEVLSGDREHSPIEHTSGLGLWVVKTIVERYGGDLYIENTDNGAAVTLGFETA